MKQIWTAALIAGLAGLTAWAQGNPPDPNDGAADPDSASHAVARLSLMNGGVSVSHGNAGEMVGASVNAPLVTTDRVLTGANSRAEVQFDGANSVRLAGSTEVRMGDLEYKRYQVQIAQGLVTFRVLRDNDAQVEISTPSVSVHPVRQGTYRISVSPDGLTEITVRSGEAEIASPTGSEPLRAGQTMTSRGPASDPEFRTSAAPSPDDWDRWNADRDRVFENYGAVSRNVPPDVYGAEDLGQYGRWTNDPAYGNVWVPNQDPDWAPYRDGRWSYIDYYGWSWVSYDPWGWAPYHYGRWYRGGFGWAWYPGAFGPRYYWSPALVGFFGWGAPGFGASLGFGFGFGNVGWCPLAPFEAFHPWWGRGFGGSRNSIVNNTTIVNNTNITNVYRNARFSGAVTSMRAGDFGRSAVGRSNFVRASATDLTHASMTGGGAPISPNRDSRGFSASPAAGGNVQGMPRTNENTRFFSAPARSAGASPAAANRSAGGSAFTGGSFAGGSSAGGSFAGRPTGGNSPAPGSSAASSSTGGSLTGGPGGGWRRFDPSASSSGRFQTFPGGTASQGAPSQGSGNRGIQSAGPRAEGGRFQGAPAAPGGGNFQGGGRVQSAPAFEGNAPRAFQGGGNSQGGGFGGGSQPVRISPPIVNNRSESFGAPRGGGSSGGFGGPRPSYGGGGGGGFRSAPSGGGGNRGGGSGGGGGNRGGGGGHSGRR